MNIPTPSVPDLARIEGTTVDSCVDWLVDFYNAPRVPWNYIPSVRIIKSAFRGIDSTSVLLSALRSERNPTSLKANWEVVSLAAPLCIKRKTQVFDISRRRFEFGAGFRSAYRIPFFFVENGLINIYYIQPRKSFCLSPDQMGMVATIHKRFILDIDFYGMRSDVEYLDFSAPAGGNKRVVKSFKLADLQLWSNERLDDRLILIAKALRYVHENRLVASRPARRPQTFDMPLFD